MGIGEIVVIIVVALLFIGPEKLPEAAKSLSKGIRDIRKQTRELRETIEEDTEFGGAIRDLQSALRGEDQQAVFDARRKLAAQKSAMPKPGSDLQAPGSTAAGELAAGAAIAGSTATDAGTAGKEPGTTPAASVGMPVIAAAGGAVARGSATAPPAPDTAAPEAGNADDAGDPAATKPAPGHVHG